MKSNETNTPELFKTWMKWNNSQAKKEKSAVGTYVATHHFVRYGDSLLVGSGTAPVTVIDRLIDQQKTDNEPLDLAILTNNLQVLYLIRDEQKEEAARVFLDTQVRLTGGTLRATLDSLTGPFAVESIESLDYCPDVIVFGAKRITFVGGLSLSYHFDDELLLQKGFALRPTKKRILVVDHSKFGSRSNCRINVSIHEMMKDANECYVLTDYPIDSKDIAIFKREEEALQTALTEIAEKPEFFDKDFVLRSVDLTGAVVSEVSLARIRDDHRQANASATSSKVVSVR
jgi:DeoR/GlpR family transcriptional regulator of sugar metabolism